VAYRNTLEVGQVRFRRDARVGAAALGTPRVVSCAAGLSVDDIADDRRDSLGSAETLAKGTPRNFRILARFRMRNMALPSLEADQA
jgi:hypothetical protein